VAALFKIVQAPLEPGKPDLGRAFVRIPNGIIKHHQAGAGGG